MCQNSPSPAHSPRDAFRQQREPRGQLSDGESGSRDTPGELASWQYVFQFEQQGLACENFNASLQGRFDQERGFRAPQQSGDDRIGVKHQAHELSGRAVPRERP